MTTMTSYFQTNTRESGDTFVTLADDVPEWVRDAVMAAHDGEMPNDWRYQTVAAIFEAFIDTPDAVPSEVAESLADVYTSDRLAWLAGHLERVNYVDEANEEAGGPCLPLVDQLGAGQFYCILAMADQVYEAIGDHLMCGTCQTTGNRDDAIELGGECAHDWCDGTITLRGGE
jgi:hypothetical protein